MKAVVIREHGGTDRLLFEEREKPRAEPGTVVLRVKTCALNHLDLWVRRGVAGHTFPLPLVPGCDFAGVVEETGEGVSHWKAGDEAAVAPGFSCETCEACRRGDDHLCLKYGIFGETTDGGCAEFARVPAVNLIRKPASLSFEEAAAAPLTFLTAWQMLTTRAQLRGGETVLIHAAGSGVSAAAIQIAKLLGARVIATAGSDEKLQRAKALGADETVHSTTQDFLKETRRITEKRGVDVVVDHVGKATFEKSLMCLRKGGRLVTCGATSGYDLSFNAALVFFKSVSVLGSTMGRREHFKEIFRHLEAGRLKAVVDRVLPLEKAREAHEILERREVFGKVVLRVG